MKKQQKNKRQCNYKVTSKTLDSRHRTQMEEFENLKTQKKQYHDEVQLLTEKLEHIKERPKKDLSDSELLDMIDLSDKISDLQRNIDQIDSNSAEIDYFTKTGNVLFEYYSLLDNSNNISAVGGNRKNKIVDSSSSTNNRRCVVDFFTKNTARQEPVEEAKDTSAASEEGGNGAAGAAGATDAAGAANNISINENNRAELLERYLSYTDENYIDNSVTNKDPTVCSFCGNEDLQLYVNESLYCCETCWTVKKVITDNERASYRDPPREISYFSYKRANHFSEWICQTQGKETTDIPEEVFDAILAELKKQRITDFTTITRQKIKDILKKIKVNKYYEHIPFILNRITGNPNPYLSVELENKLKEMFASIQVAFLRHAPLIRKNFLSYSYVLHKFLQLLGQDSLLQYFPLLKSREKLMQQEVIWRKICEDLNWRFIRSI